MSAISTHGSQNPDSAVILNFNLFPNEFLAVGYSRTYSFGNLTQDSVLSTTETVSVPAGNFNNCIEILETQFNSSGVPIFREYHYYANGVGMVKNVRTIPNSEAHTDELISYVVTGVEEVNHPAPSAYSLSQNYPNPFNPITKISWQSPVSSWQTLIVYDVLGNEVQTLVNEVRSAGNYELEYNASGLSSGFYFYKLTAGSFAETKKMLLMK